KENDFCHAIEDSPGQWGKGFRRWTISFARKYRRLISIGHPERAKFRTLEISQCGGRYTGERSNLEGSVEKMFWTD
ncbi:hypothetical protein L9F63_024733, partial [Diploptera punctata]